MKKWLKILLVILVFAIISVAIFLILKAFNITNLSTLRSLINNSGDYSYIVYTLILSFLLVALCFVPLLNTTLAILGITLFGAKIAFITNMIAVFISSSILFFIGDKLGEKFASKLVGKKNLEETQNAIDHKSKFWLPILFVTPGVPDEAICLVAGITKIKYWHLLIVSLIYHAVEIGIFCFFGSDLINWSALSILEWVIVCNIFVIDLHLLTQLEKSLAKRKQNKNHPKN